MAYNSTPELETLQRQLNRLFDEFFVPTENTYSVPAELQVTDEAVILNLELPGLKREDIDVQVTKKEVFITAERQQEQSNNTRSEFRYGKFQRVIALPVAVDNVNVQAEYKDGILSLTLPKAAEEKNKVIKVQIG